jgi:hypothetical protein
MQGMKGSENRPPDDTATLALAALMVVVLCFALAIGYIIGQYDGRLVRMGDDSAKDVAQAELAMSGISGGQIYRHYKGGYYCVVAVSLKEDTLEPLVTYHSNLTDTDWTRTLQNFTEMVELPNGERIKRFTRVEQ